MAGLLEQEIAQTKPLSLVNRAAANLHRSSALLMREVGACLSAKGVSAQQYNILRILHGAGDNGLRCGEVASRLVTPDPDTTRLLDRLVARKWVRRARDQKDRRVVRVRISASGLDLLHVLEPSVEAIQKRQFQHLSDLSLQKLISLLESLRTR